MFARVGVKLAKDQINIRTGQDKGKGIKMEKIW